MMLQMVEAIRKEDVERLNELVDEFNEVKGDPEQLRFFWEFNSVSICLTIEIGIRTPSCAEAKTLSEV